MFADNLRKIRIEKGISQEQLGEVINVSRQSISKYESGYAEPNYDRLIAIANFFEVSTDYLLMSKLDVDTSKRKSDRITVISKLDTLGVDGIASYYNFSISRIIGRKQKSPEAMLWGTYDSGLFGDKKCMLACYRSYENAKKEIMAINDAMQKGETNYELQYFVNIKSSGLDYVMVE